jgi:hypothetical protein
MSYDNLSSVSQNVLKLYRQLTGEERRIPFIFDDFQFCHSRVIGLDMMENSIFTLCRMITWVVFLRMFWNFISSLPLKRVGSLSFLVGTISNVLVMEIGWTDVGSGRYILVSCANSNTSLCIHMWCCCFDIACKYILPVHISEIRKKFHTFDTSLFPCHRKSCRIPLECLPYSV